jgi:uroporphyrinogen decarboxylase
MTSALDRLRAALEGRPLDRIPIFCNLLDQGARELGLSTRAYYASGEHVAEGQLRMRARFGYDNVWGLFYVGKEAELLGDAQIVFADDGPPNVARYPLSTHDDIARLEIPRDLATHPALEEPLRALRILRREVGGKQPICVYVTAATTLPAIGLGLEHWLGLLLGGPAEVRDELLAKCSLLVQRQIELYRAEGADVILYANPFGSTDFLPRPLISSLVLPWVARDLAPCGGDGIVYYGGSARLGDVLDDTLAAVNVRAFYPGPEDDVAATCRALSAGVINDIRLIDESPGEIRADVRRILAAGASAKRFLFGTVLMPYAIPEVNIRAMLDAALEFGVREGSGR